MRNLSIIAVALFFLFISCSKNETQNEIEETGKSETIEYQIDEKKIVASFRRDKKTNKLVLVENESSKILNQIFDENENLIQYYLDKDVVILFKNDLELELYLEEIGRPLLSSKDISAKSSLINATNLQIYNGCCYVESTLINWNCPNSNSTYHGYSYDRLKDLSTANRNRWSRNLFMNNSVEACGEQTTVYRNYSEPTPDDEITSVKAHDVLARFYEHPNYRGQSITLDARGGKTLGFNDLHDVTTGSFWKRKRWSNIISSISLQK